MSNEVKRLGLIGLIVVVVVGVVVGVSYYRKSTAPTPTEALVREDSHALGTSDAAVTLVEFGDFQCPACAQAEPVIQQIRADYAQEPNFRFVFRHFPLTIHPNAVISAEAAEAAGAQGKFWEMHDTLYQNQNAWSTLSDPVDVFVGYAGQIGVADVNRFREALENHDYQQAVRDDEKDGNALGVNVTPTFFLNGEKLEGVQAYEELRAKIDALLASAPTPTTAEATGSAQE